MNKSYKYKYFTLRCAHPDYGFSQEDFGSLNEVAQFFQLTSDDELAAFNILAEALDSMTPHATAKQIYLNVFPWSGVELPFELEVYDE